MNNTTLHLTLAGALLCATSTAAYAAPWNVVAGENMVMLPPEIMLPSETKQPEPKKPVHQHKKKIRAAKQAVPAPVPAPVEENMVMVPEFTLNGENMVMVPEVDGNIFVPITGPTYVEAGVNFHNVSNNQGDWSGQFVNGQVQTDAKNRWNAQVQHQKAFHDTGTFVGVGNTHTYNDKWFSEVGVGMGSNASFLPRYRADAAASRRWLDGGNLVTTFGGTVTKATDTYSSVGILLGASYYFNSPWVAQGGIRVDRSNPGSVYATSGFGALTYGYQKRYYLTGRVGYGREAYQLLGATRITNAFNSSNAGLNWRQWIGETWGFNVGGEYYRNPAYHRTGTIFSLFKEF